jgi:hypothetical protein
MTPREKADELYSKYDDLLNTDFMNPIVFDNKLKQCALIAVDEVLNILNRIEHADQWETFWFYNEVKREIDRL